MLYSDISLYGIYFQYLDWPSIGSSPTLYCLSIALVGTYRMTLFNI